MVGQLVVGEVLLQLGDLEEVQQIRPHRHLVLAGDGDVGNHVIAAGSAAHQQHLAPGRVHAGVVVAGVAAAALGARQRGLGDAFADQQHVAQVDRQVPAGVVLTVSLHLHVLESLAKLVQPAQRLGDFVRVADDAHQVVHRLLQFQVQGVRILRRGAVRRSLEGGERPLRRRVDGVLVDGRAAAQRPRVVGGAQTGAPAEDQ